MVFQMYDPSFPKETPISRKGYILCHIVKNYIYYYGYFMYNILSNDSLNAKKKKLRFSNSWKNERLYPSFIMTIPKAGQEAKLSANICGFQIIPLGLESVP